MGRWRDSRTDGYKNGKIRTFITLEGIFNDAVHVACKNGVRRLLPGSPKTHAMMPRKVLDVAERCGWSHLIVFDWPHVLSFRTDKKR